MSSTGRPEVILIADDDPDLSAHLQMTLRHEGYEVHAVDDGGAVLDLARRVHPDLVLLDVEMPYVSGYDACRTLRSDATTATTPIIMVTGHDGTEARVQGLDLGADDYVAKPFATPELLARVRSVLRRSGQMRAASPLTGLPGNERIIGAIDAAVAAGNGFAVVYADLDHFKAFNDSYGFVRGDAVIQFTARVLTNQLAGVTGEPRFAGHVGGDDFVVLCPPDSVEAFCGAAVAAFDAAIAQYYDAADAARGFLEVDDRQGRPHRFPLMTISLAVATTASRAIGSAAEAAEIATELKKYAKGIEGSAFVVDRRRS